jgi:hypothetical protein
VIARQNGSNTLIWAHKQAIRNDFAHFPWKLDAIALAVFLL